MSTKPSAAQLPTWDTNLTNVGSGITAGHKTDGFANGFVPTSPELNTLFAFYYLWIKYLSDGAFSGASSFDNTLSIAGLLTATAGITCGANTNINLSGTGKVQRGTRTRHLPASAAQIVSTPATGVQYFAGSTIAFRAVGNTFSCAIELEEGEQLQSVRAYTITSTGDTITMKVFKCSPVIGSTGPTDAQLGTTQTDSAHGSLVVQLAVTGLTENIPSSSTPVSYRVEVACTAFTTSPSCVGFDYTTIVP